MRNFISTLLSVFIVCVSACTSDLVDEKTGQKSVKFTLRLGTSYQQDGGADIRQTKAAAFQDPYAVEGEMFNDAYVVMVNSASQQVAGIYHVLPTEGRNESEREVVAEIKDLSDTFDFYNFANMKFTATVDEGSTEISDLTVNGQTFTVGQTIPAGLDTLTYKTTFNNFDLEAPNSDGVKGIPMSNVQRHVVVNDQQTVVLQLYRMASKIRFLFTNNTGQVVNIKKIRVDGITQNDRKANVIEDNPPEIQSLHRKKNLQVYKDIDLADKPSRIFFLPPRSADGQDSVAFPQVHRVDSLFVYNDKTGADIPADGVQRNPIPDCYFNESRAEHPTGQTLLTITAERIVDGDYHTEDIRLGLMKHRDYYRNSIVFVPITLTDYMVDLQAFFYPPIGGYPPYNLEKHEKEFYATFEGGGDFILLPLVYKFVDRDNPEKWIELNDASLIQSYNINVSGNMSIFSVVPHFDPTTGELLGTLKGGPENQGTAEVRLTIYIKVSDTVTQEYRRTIYIIAK